MSITPDYVSGPMKVYEPLGVVKTGNGYVDYIPPVSIVFNADFISSNGISFYYYEDFIGIFYNNRIYDGTKPVLISSHNNVYDYDTFAQKIGQQFNAVLAKNKFHYICPIDCVTQINENYTFMKINHYNVLVEGMFSASHEPENEHIAVTDNDNKNYIATIQVEIHDLKCCFDEEPPKILAGPDKTVEFYMSVKCTDIDVKCPYAAGHDPDCCEIIKFIISDTVYLVVICSGKIRLVDGKAAGQRTKAAAHESE